MESQRLQIACTVHIVFIAPSAATLLCLVLNVACDSQIVRDSTQSAPPLGSKPHL